MIELGVPGLGPGVLIGSGGSAAVFSARNAEGEEVAVKILRSTAVDERSRKQFHREIEAIEALSGHPGIVPILATGVTDRGEPYLEMPLLDRSLHDKIDAVGPMRWDQAVDLIAEVGAAVQHAHDAGVLHRDIKPANILLAADGRPYMADFGIAKFSDSSTLSSQIAATPSFAPPERFRGQASTVQSDVYSLAATLYALIAGHAPFSDNGAGAEVVMRRVLDEAPPPLERRLVPKPVEQVIRQALANEATTRPATVSSFVQQLRKGAPATTTVMGGPSGVEFTDPDRSTEVMTSTAAPERQKVRATGIQLGLLFAVVIVGVAVLLMTRTSEPAADESVASTPQPESAQPVLEQPTTDTNDPLLPTPAGEPSPIPTEEAMADESIVSEAPIAVDGESRSEGADTGIRLTGTSIGSVAIGSSFSSAVASLSQQLGEPTLVEDEASTWERGDSQFRILRSEEGTVQGWRWSEVGPTVMESPPLTEFAFSFDLVGFTDAVLNDASFIDDDLGIYTRWLTPTSPTKFCFFEWQYCLDYAGSGAFSASSAERPQSLSVGRARDGMLEASHRYGWFHVSGEFLVLRASSASADSYLIQTQNGEAGLVSEEIEILRTGIDPSEPWTQDRGRYVATAQLDLRDAPDGSNIGNYDSGTRLIATGEAITTGTNAWLPVRSEYAQSWDTFAQDRTPIGIGWVRETNIAPESTQLFGPTVPLLNLRSEPAGEILTELPADTRLTLTAPDLSIPSNPSFGSRAEDTIWVKVATQAGQTGWVARDRIELR